MLRPYLQNGLRENTAKNLAVTLEENDAMHRRVHLLGIVILHLCCQAVPKVTAAQTADGPLGLQWGMTKEAVEKLGIGLCCRQVGKYGARYGVASEDFANFPNPLGDEAKV